MPPENDDKNKADDKNKGVDHAKEIADLKAMNASLIERFEKLEKSKKSKAKDEEEDDVDDETDEDEDLRSKAKKSRDDADKNKNNTKALEAAIRFNMGANEWLKTNASLLPKDVSDIFQQAEKEKYEDQIEKDAAIKSGIIQSFFSVQSNLDLLTPGLKSTLEDYLKLTKNGKQEKAREIYDTIFEPSFEMLRRVKKAEALTKGHGDGGDDAYKKKLMSGSRKHHLGEKQ